MRSIEPRDIAIVLGWAGMCVGLFLALGVAWGLVGAGAVTVLLAIFALEV